MNASQATDELMLSAQSSPALLKERQDRILQRLTNSIISRLGPRRLLSDEKIAQIAYHEVIQELTLRLVAAQKRREP